MTEQPKEYYEKILFSAHNIVEDGDGYRLQNNFYKDGDNIVQVKSILDSSHNCSVCSHYKTTGSCDIYNKLLNLQENSLMTTAQVVSCDAFDVVNKMNIVGSLDDMVSFIEKTKNFFDSQEDYERYYGFERNWDEETGEMLETVREYYNRGGVFENIPTKYPCVIRFDWNCTDDLEWIYIGQ